MKKYSERFINSTNILKKAVIGFEFEFYMSDLSYYKTLEILNQYLSPVKVHGFRQYHSNFVPDDKNFKIEPDLSGGANMVELVTGPLEYFEAKHYLVKILKFIQEYGYTNEKSSIHFNLSFNDDELNLNDLNVLKLILMVNEDEIYSIYPSRKNNIYAKSIKSIIPYKQYDFNNVGINVVKNNLRLPDDKYYGINFTNINNKKESQRLEFRYIGGKGYEKNIGQINYFLDKFILNTHECINSGFNDFEIDQLDKYLLLNIDNFKNLSKYDNFIVDFPTISLQVDQYNNYDIVNAYYSKLFNGLFDIVDSTDSLSDCIINFVTGIQKFEIIDADLKSTKNINGYDFINCLLTDGIYENCTFVNCEIKNCQLTKSTLTGCDSNDTKLMNCKVEASTLNNCYFVNGFLNCDMIGGVFRSGKIGPYANISSDTKMVTDYNNFFDTYYDDDYERKKSNITKFKNKI